MGVLKKLSGFELHINCNKRVNGYPYRKFSYFCFRKIRWSLRMIMGMKSYCLLPPKFGRLFPCGRAGYRGMVLHLGSGRRPLRIRGGTTWLLEASPAKRGSGCIDGRVVGTGEAYLVACRRAKPPFARICAIRENIDSDPCVSLGKRAEAIPKLIVLAITSL